MPHAKYLMPLLIMALPAAAQAQASYDVIIRGGEVFDGTGRPAFKADVAVRQGHVVKVGDLGPATAATVIDASGRYVTPGFLNIHSHARQSAVATAANMLTQGVTTEFINADGGGATDLTTQLKAYAADGMAENIGGLVGFNSVWAEVIGKEDRRPTEDQITAMRTLIAANMAKGAWGVSAGLDYKPGYFAAASEVIRVVSAAAPWRTHFTNHDRLRPEENYSSNKGVAETIAIGEGAGLLPLVTHIKSQGAEQGRAGALIDMMNAATARGHTTTADVYPYLAGMTNLAALMIPGWALDGGREPMLARFRDPAQRERVIAEAERAITLRWKGPDGVTDVDTKRTLASWAAEWNVRPGEALIRLLEEKDRSAILRFGAESDLVAFLRFPGAAMACDCGAVLGPPGHPRNYGSFPRVLGHYVRETGVLTWAQATAKMTGLPAQITGVVDRGFLAPGMSADVTVFDPATIIDNATYEAPSQFSTGVDAVLVNGVVALRDGKVTGQQGGSTILRSSHMPSRPLAPVGVGKLSGAGKLADGAWTVAFDVSQAPGDRLAHGRLKLTGGGEVWTATDFGVVQTAPGWASVTVVLSDAKGRSASAVLLGDTLDPTAPTAGPTLSVLWNGETLTGKADRLKITPPQ